MLICWQKSLANSVRAGALLGTFVGCFQGEGKKEVATETVHKVYINIIRALGCFLLFSFSFVLAKLASRAMSVRYHQKAYFQKMHDALQKVNQSPLSLRPSPLAFYATPSFNIHIELFLACHTRFSDEASQSLQNSDPRQVGHDVSHEVGHQLWLWDQSDRRAVNHPNENANWRLTFVILLIANTGKDAFFDFETLLYCCSISTVRFHECLHMLGASLAYRSYIIVFRS